LIVVATVSVGATGIFLFGAWAIIPE
jgi:hypothetical protein